MIIYLKEKNDIEGFVKAGAIAGKILKELVENIKIGTTTKEINEVAFQKCKENNGEPTFLNYKGFPFSICASKNKTMVHGFPDSLPLQPDDILSIDFGFTLNGYIGDVATTIAFKDNCLISSCKLALDLAIKNCYAGQKLNDIGKIVEDTATKNKFLVPLNYGGHGIDKNKLHSAPFIPNFYNFKNDITLYPGMVLAVEPMFIESKSNNTKILSDGWSVVAEGNTSHFEHTILITDGEPVVLTKGE